jgi:hypothetical protein
MRVELKRRVAESVQIKLGARVSLCHFGWLAGKVIPGKRD